MRRHLITVGLVLWSGCHLVFPFDHDQDARISSPDGVQTSADTLHTDLRGEGSLSDTQAVWDKGTTPQVDKSTPQLKDQSIPQPEDKGIPQPKDKGITPPLDGGPCGCVDPQCCSNCAPIAAGITCTGANGYPHHCDGQGNCIECIGQGDLCGTDPKPCCGSLICGSWPSYPWRGDTCGP